MNLFCRLLGHTWIHDSEEPKIRWSTDKEMVELHATVEGEPRFFERCVRCDERRPWQPKSAKKVLGA